jgi:hypothetical protein
MCLVVPITEVVLATIGAEEGFLHCIGGHCEAVIALHSTRVVGYNTLLPLRT